MRDINITVIPFLPNALTVVKMVPAPVLSELHSMVSFSARRPILGPCFIHVATVNWSVRFWGTT